MNLVMPLADQTAVGRAKAVQAVAANIDELFTGLSNVGTVHFARFDLVGGNLCMFSVFDGDFRAYIRDFISVFGSVFDSLLGLVADPPPSPSSQHPEAFIDWIHRHDSFQIPRDLTALFPEEKNIKNLSRDLVLLLDENPNVQIGRFSGYPGHFGGTDPAQDRNGVVSVSNAIDFADIQGNILRGYRKDFVRHLVLTVNKPAAARRWLSAAISGDETVVPQITTAEEWPDGGRRSCVNFGITHAGLAALGVPSTSLDSFPIEFKQAWRRATS